MMIGFWHDLQAVVCPIGTLDVSPAIYRWVLGKYPTSPVGGLAYAGTESQRSLFLFQPSLRDLRMVFGYLIPRDKSLG